MKIRINDKDNVNIAECELWEDAYGNTFFKGSTNIENAYSNLEQGKYGFEETIDIDIIDLIPPKRLLMIKSLSSAWAVFETLRSEYVLGCSDDAEYTLEILIIPKIYGYMGVNEYNKNLQAVYDFFGWDGESFTNSKYDYDELDRFIRGLNPVYNV